MDADTPAVRAARALLNRRAGVPANLADLGYVELTPALLAWARAALPELVTRWRGAGATFSAGYRLGLDRLTRALPDVAFSLLTEGELLDLWTRDGVWCYSCCRRTRWISMADFYCGECGRDVYNKARRPWLEEVLREKGIDPAALMARAATLARARESPERRPRP